MTVEACFEVEAEGIFVTETITDNTVVLDRANKLYEDMCRRTEGEVSLRMIVRTGEHSDGDAVQRVGHGYEIVINLR